MGILLDTRVYLWILEDSKRLSAAAKQRLNGEYPRYVSAVSFAEIEIKRSIGKLTLPDNYREAFDATGLTLLEYSAADSAPLLKLPFHHEDPFDRMLIAQSITRNLPLATGDPVFGRYGIDVWIL
jgi:PIN domain nuclease of toxin-antitoxin system